MKTRLPAIESLDQMVEVTAAGLSQAAAASAYELFCGKEFRAMARLERLSHGERDRIFNELVVAFLVLIMLLLEAPDLRVSRELRNYFADLNKRIPEAYVEHLRTLGLDSNHIGDWENLISMRCEQYERDKHAEREAATKLETAQTRLDCYRLSSI